ncbi:MAG: exo-alpha-sialidase [Acidobacteria bacterium]|nr:MAG: exo-alpha-sialidase [Acidobacteriota bacterium]
MTTSRILTATAFVAGVAAAIVSSGDSAAAVQNMRQTTLGVPGAGNSAPSLAVLDRTVVAVWGAALQGGAANVYIATSADAGATFSAPRRVNDQDGDASVNSEQPPRAVISGPAGARTITVVWSKRNEGPARSRRDVVRSARSADGGRTFSAARDIHDAGLSGARGWESLASGQSGAVHAVWLDGRDAERKIAEATAHSGVAHKGQPPQDVYHGILTPDGRRVETVIASGVCFCCKTAVAVDARGTVYAAWRHIFPGSMRDIAFAKSGDGGRHFDPLVRVSEDRWELNGCPEDGPAIAVDQAGIIHIAWATLIDEGEPQKAVFYAVSRDGKTFSQRARVPTAGITPGHPQLTVTPDGGAAIVWDETVDGLRRVSFSRVSANRAVGPAQVLSGREPASHPVIVRSGANLIVAWASREEARIRLHRLNVSR